MEDKKDARDSFIKLANKKFTEKDVFIRLSYKGNRKKPIDTSKDILRFLKMPFVSKYEPTFELEVGKELVKIIYFEEVGCGKVFWFLVDKDFAWSYKVET